MAAHGVSRSTGDVDLLTLSIECLAPDFWNDVHVLGIQADVRRGDAADPLAGVVRLTVAGDDPVDLVVGKSAWQAPIFQRAQTMEIEGVRVPIASRLDLILLKLFAGGPQDLWDVEQLLAGTHRAGLTAEVDAALAALPPSLRDTWVRVRHDH
jgi:hypothetical protein